MVATGNISRGIAIFTTSALLRMIDRVPALKVSLKKWTRIRPANRWIGKFGTSLWAWNRKPITNQ